MITGRTPTDHLQHLQQQMEGRAGRNEPPVLGPHEHEAIARATEFATGLTASGGEPVREWGTDSNGRRWERVNRGPIVWQDATGYHSVAGQPAQALQGTQVAPLTLVDFIDDRVRAIDAERLRLMMVKEQLTAAGVTMGLDDLRRLLG